VVQEGSPVASISLVPSTFELERLENNVKMAKINFDATKLSYERSEKLFQAQTISEVAMENARKEYNSAREQLTSAQNQLSIQKTGKVLGSKNTSNIVKSSISGSVIDLPLEEGASVIERNTLNSGITVAILAKMGQFVFRTQLAEQYLENIHLGDSISLVFNAYKDLKTQAKITKISSKGLRSFVVLNSRLLIFIFEVICSGLISYFSIFSLPIVLRLNLIIKSLNRK